MEGVKRVKGCKGGWGEEKGNALWIALFFMTLYAFNFSSASSFSFFRPACSRCSSCVQKWTRLHLYSIV